MLALDAIGCRLPSGTTIEATLLPLPDRDMLGYTTWETAERVPHITIDADRSDWPAGAALGPAVRSTVRHEVAHALLEHTGWTGEQLRAMFPDPIDWTRPGMDDGREVGADAVAEALSRATGQPRTLWYVETFTEASLTAAIGLTQELCS